MLLGGCRRVLPEAAQEPVSRTLLGTWTGTFGYSRYDATADVIRTGTLVHTLTFTRSRWIHHQAQVPDDGSMSSGRADSGTWEVAGNTVIRKWTGDDGAANRVAKSYHWIDEVGDVLFMQPWELHFPELRGYFVRYTRVKDPLPVPLTGTWTTSITDQFDGSIISEITLRIDADGSLSFSAEADQLRFHLTAHWSADREHNFLILTEPTAFVETSAGRNPIPGVNEDSTLRIGYAPTNNSPDEIVISEFWSEAGWPEDGPFDPEDEDGNYRLTLQHQP